MRKTAWRKVAALAVAGGAAGLLPVAAAPAWAATPAAAGHGPSGAVTIDCVEWGCHPSSNVAGATRAVAATTPAATPAATGHGLAGGVTISCRDWGCPPNEENLS